MAVSKLEEIAIYLAGGDVVWSALDERDRYGYFRGAMHIMSIVNETPRKENSYEAPYRRRYSQV